MTSKRTNVNDNAYDAALAQVSVSETDPLDQKFSGPETLLGTALDVTVNWQDAGAEIPMTGYTKLGVWINIDIGDSENFRIRALAKHTSAGADEYIVPIRTVYTDKVSIEEEYLEFNEDEDQLVLFEVDTNNLVPYIQLQISAGVVDATAGQADEIVITKSYSPAGPRQSQKPFALDVAFDSVANNVHVVEDNPLSSQFVPVTHVNDTGQVDAWNDYFIDMDNYKNVGIQFSLQVTSGECDGYIWASLQSDGTAPADCFYTNMTSDLTGSTSIRATAGSDANDIVFIDTSQPIKYVKIQIGNNSADTANITIFSKKQA